MIFTRFCLHRNQSKNKYSINFDLKNMYNLLHSRNSNLTVQVWYADSRVCMFFFSRSFEKLTFLNNFNSFNKNVACFKRMSSQNTFLKLQLSLENLIKSFWQSFSNFFFQIIHLPLCMNTLYYYMTRIQQRSGFSCPRVYISREKALDI